MKKTARRRFARRGVTLVEMAMAIAIIGILAAFAFISFGKTDEMRDAAMVSSAQASLQTIVSQGSLRMDVRPDQLNPQAVETAFRSIIGENGASNQGVRFTSNGGGRFTLTFNGTNRAAVFQITGNGDVSLENLSSNFTKYGVTRANNIGTIDKI